MAEKEAGLFGDRAVEGELNEGPRELQREPVLDNEVKDDLGLGAWECDRDLEVEGKCGVRLMKGLEEGELEKGGEYQDVDW